MSEFDKVAQSYDEILKADTQGFSHDVSYFSRYKVNEISFNTIIKPLKILEYGCGTGRNLPFLQEAFPYSEIYAFDISQESLEVAKNTTNSIFFVSEADLFENKFDIIFISNVFHHISPKERKKVMNDLHSLLNLGGEIFIFEHNPINPITSNIVKKSPLDKNAILLPSKELKQLLTEAGFENLKLKFVLFVPPVLKKLTFIDKYLYWLPIGGQYYFKGVK